MVGDSPRWRTNASMAWRRFMPPPAGAGCSAETPPPPGGGRHALVLARAGEAGEVGIFFQPLRDRVVQRVGEIGGEGDLRRAQCLDHSFYDLYIVFVTAALQSSLIPEFFTRVAPNLRSSRMN